MSEWEDEGPSVEEMARNVASGLWYQDCQVQFTREHGEPVSCNHCVNQREELGIKEVVVRARHEEANVAAHKQVARQRRAQRHG